MDTSLVSTGEAARRLRLSPERVRQLARQGKLPATGTALGLLFNTGDLDRFARDRALRRLSGTRHRDLP